jgi:hypothetical protein
VTDAAGTHTFAYTSDLAPDTETLSAGLHSRVITRLHQTAGTGVPGRDAGFEIGTGHRHGAAQSPRRPYAPPPARRYTSEGTRCWSSPGRRYHRPSSGPHANPQGAVHLRSSHTVSGRGVTAGGSTIARNRRNLTGNELARGRETFPDGLLLRSSPTRIIPPLLLMCSVPCSILVFMHHLLGAGCYASWKRHNILCPNG